MLFFPLPLLIFIYLFFKKGNKFTCAKEQERGLFGCSCSHIHHIFFPF
uniref:Uncharacterized protein n=1 Tax=Anguilla anguilla TaxID=7936 RepID=A0A0E9UEA0_ANGAN